VNSPHPSPAPEPLKHSEEPRVASLPDGLDPDAFKLAFRHHPAGVAVVTADAGDGPVGLTATSVSSISATPPLLMFSISSQSSSASTLRRAETLVVHLLGADQLDIAKLCATSGVDRFADTTLWERLITGEPFFPSAQTWIRGRVIDRMEAGASTVIAVHALQAGHAAPPGSGRPLVYHDRRWHTLGDGSLVD
jgi:flavin reductase (DIM6/NTAB) family NADH-FMN oxidoreductase RutF